MPTQQHNAISRRINQLTRSWTKFSAEPSNTTCIWSCKEDEVEMIDAFFEFETSEHGKTPDLFLKFTTPYLGNDLDYNKNLIQELNKQIESSEKDFEEAGVDIKELKKNFAKGISARTNFLHLLEQFSQLLEIQGNLVAFFSPSKNKDIKFWIIWLEKNLRYKAGKVKVMLCQLEKSQDFERLKRVNPKQTVFIQPELNMEAAVTELAAQGNPSDPGTKFRKLYVAMMQAATKGDLLQVKEIAKSAFRLTRKNNWKLMEATIHMVLGGVLINNKKKKDGLAAYNNAIGLLQKEIIAGNKLAQQQIVMAYLSKGMTLFLLKQHGLAANVYEAAAQAAAADKNDFLTMDSWRMAGTSHIKNNALRKGEACLKRSIISGKRLEADMLKTSTFPHAAKALFDLSLPNEKQALDKDMTTLLGKNWQELTNPKKVKALN